jgi:putative membrane protein
VRNAEYAQQSPKDYKTFCVVTLPAWILNGKTIAAEPRFHQHRGVSSSPHSGLDLRQHFALERTLLAYVRTGLALIGVGFVIARFGLLLRELGVRIGTQPEVGLSLWFGSALVFIGGAIGPLAGATYYHQLRRLNRAMGLEEKPVLIAIALSALQALLGIGMAAYLITTN